MELITNIILALVFVAMILAAHVADYYQENKEEDHLSPDQESERGTDSHRFTDW